eukprot:GHVT01032487.1.p1 GENE.GHVT01032487.1~~GHVT01032487.1.p1  ORF type:complete len:223 (+),score=47.29 GHVT01032487.1:480-1148(+)
MVILERGTPTGFRIIHALRELFISELGIDNFHFVAPCPHESVCPLALTGRDWCHFSQRIHRWPHYVYSKGSRAKNVEEEKFSFLAIRKSMGPRRLYPTEEKAVGGLAKSFFWPRVVMPPIRAGGHVLIDVCAAPHSFERLAVSYAMPHAAGYRQSRKLQWGDLWRFPRRLCRPEARSYSPEETKVHLRRLLERTRKAARGHEDADEKLVAKTVREAKENFGG